jgi:hypothetical protein
VPAENGELIMVDGTNPATTAGPNGDGSKSLAKESKVGAGVQFVITAAAVGLAGALANLDTSHWSGYIGMVGISVVGLAGGLLASYTKRNR